MYEHNALGYWLGLALCLTKVRSSRARCPATALIFFLFFFFFKERIVCGLDKSSMFCPCRVGEIPEVCFMHIKRAECGETTWAELWKGYENPLVQGQVNFEDSLVPSKTYLSNKRTTKLFSSKTNECNENHISCKFVCTYACL